MQQLTTAGSKIAIACQGGGSHTAFTAGVLKKLLQAQVDDHYEIVGLSGTSGGAICATTAWYGLLKKAQGSPEPTYKWLVDFWQANSANLMWEKYVNSFVINTIRWQDSGMMPAYAANPYNSQWLLNLWQSLSPRKEYMNFRGLLEKHINFDEITSLTNPSSPRLLLGAANILDGEFKAFDSLKQEIVVEAIMASAGIPTIFEAIEIGKAAYWDGLFSENPPLRGLIETDITLRPEEIWVIQINPTASRSIPMTAASIIDRRNELAGNLSLYQEIRFIELVNKWIEENLFRDEHQWQFKPITIRWIQMSEQVSEKLDYASKLDRSPSFIQMLMQDGEKQATHFLMNLNQVSV